MDDNEYSTVYSSHYWFVSEFVIYLARILMKSTFYTYLKVWKKNINMEKNIHVLLFVLISNIFIICAQFPMNFCISFRSSRHLKIKDKNIFKKISLNLKYVCHFDTSFINILPWELNDFSSIRKILHIFLYKMAIDFFFNHSILNIMSFYTYIFLKFYTVVWKR